MPSNTQPSTSPLYRYAILAAVVLFAAVFATVYFRSRVERRRRHALRASAIRHGFWDVDLEWMKPPLFDAYLGAPQIREEAGAEADGWGWDEIMPLAVSNIGVGSAKGEDVPADPVRVRVSVVVRMPVSPFSAPDPPGGGAGEEEGQREVPYVELAVAEVVMSHGDATKSIPL